MLRIIVDFDLPFAFVGLLAEVFGALEQFLVLRFEEMQGKAFYGGTRESACIESDGKRWRGRTQIAALGIGANLELALRFVQDAQLTRKRVTAFGADCDTASASGSVAMLLIVAMDSFASESQTPPVHRGVWCRDTRPPEERMAGFGLRWGRSEGGFRRARRRLTRFVFRFEWCCRVRREPGTEIEFGLRPSQLTASRPSTTRGDCVPAAPCWEEIPGTAIWSSPARQ